MGNSPLHAIENNNISALRSIPIQKLESCVNDLMTERKTTLLVIACEKSNLEIIKILLCIPNVNVNLHKPPLFIACEKNSLEIVKLLLNVPSINVNQEYIGMTPLSRVCKLGHVQIVKELLKYSNININQCVSQSSVLLPNIVKSPLRNACKEGHIEIIKLLLTHHSDIIIGKSDIEYAQRYEINLIELYEKTSHKKTNEPELVNITLKKFEMDEIKYTTPQISNRSINGTTTKNSNITNNSNSGGIIVFKPLLLKIAPTLMEQVINNQPMMSNLNSDERHALESIVDFLIYGHKWKIHASPLSVLFILNRVEHCGELITTKQECIESVVKSISFDTLLDTIDLIKEYIERDFILHNNTIEQLNHQSLNSTSSSSLDTNNSNILNQLREYCLDVMGAQRKHPDFIKVKQDSRFASYLVDVFDRDTMRSIIVDEQLTMKSQYPISELYNDTNSTDIILNVNGQSQPCHKTILASSSAFFQAFFTGGWSHSITSQQDEYPEEMIYIIEYCYGIVKQVPPRLIVQVLKKAHEHEMKCLFDMVYSRIHISIQSFYDIIDSLYESVELEMFTELRARLIQFAVENNVSLDLLNRFKEMPMCMRDDLIERMLIKEQEYHGEKKRKRQDHLHHDEGDEKQSKERKKY